ncbi:hypothetical protein PUN28_008339 [Cardiocondyla obscurior]|uniref:Uncharacterized protein n=1 Tax=Cardiocondyla obscurior TaxID=286306 RepID=A0AAW2G092_9HYME
MAPVITHRPYNRIVLHCFMITRYISQEIFQVSSDTVLQSECSRPSSRGHGKCRHV